MGAINVVSIGGGNGHKQILMGAKMLPEFVITALVTAFDDGGSTGKLCKMFPYVARGYYADLTTCIAALGSDRDVVSIFEARFEEKGNGFYPHTIKNLALLKAEMKFKTRRRAWEALYRECGTGPHKVFPVTVEPATLTAILDISIRINGEWRISALSRNKLYNPDMHGISKLCLTERRIEEEGETEYDDSLGIPDEIKVAAYPPSIRTIKEADLIIIPTGNTFTSINAAMLSIGTKAAIMHSKAKIVLFLNLMTWAGEDGGYSAGRIIETVEHAMGRKCDFILYNTDPIPRQGLHHSLSYRNLLQVQPGDMNGADRFIAAPLACLSSKGFPRHIPELVARALKRLLKKL